MKVLALLADTVSCFTVPTVLSNKHTQEIAYYVTAVYGTILLMSLTDSSQTAQFYVC